MNLTNTNNASPHPEVHSGRWCQKSVSWVSFWLFIFKVSLDNKYTGVVLNKTAGSKGTVCGVRLRG